MKTMLFSILYGLKELNEKAELGFDENGFYLADHGAIEPEKREQHIPFRNPHTLQNLQDYRRGHYAMHPSIDFLFPERKKLLPGEECIPFHPYSNHGNPEINGIAVKLSREEGLPNEKRFRLHIKLADGTDSNFSVQL